MPEWYAGKNSLFFFSYFVHLDQEAGEAGKFYSRQWEKLPEQLQKQGYQLNWMHLFLTSPVIPNAQTGINWLERFYMDSKQEGKGNTAWRCSFATKGIEGFRKEIN